MLFHVAGLPFSGEIEFVFGSCPGFLDDSVEKDDFLIDHDEESSGDAITE